MKKAGGELAKVLAQHAEAVIDIVVDSPLVKAIPVVNYAVALAKELGAVRDRLLMSKLEKFLQEPRLQRTLESEAMRNKLIEDEYAEEIGERLLLVIEKFSDLQKPVLLGRIFAAYLNDELTRTAFFMLAHAIDVAYLGDLEYFIQVEGEPVHDDMLAVPRLANAGLFELYADGSMGGGDLKYQTTPLGNSLYACLRQVD
ncbi:hypothetical protein [Herbaspirillum sp. 1130]|uniref:hypothetical protein n=1 Tax=Herbaspirillum sp. 1130 TaxID=2806562 RepID=UPI001AEA00D8|nr:hypothetical protein [Herbaspirillum sp. 1130]MBP1314525.1 hypothetical protein [Herbaspirillum sp. 1130]